MSNSKTAVVYPCETRDSHGFGWKWRDRDNKGPGVVFTYFIECVEDARKNGYEILIEAGGSDTPEPHALVPPPGQPLLK